MGWDEVSVNPQIIFNIMWYSYLGSPPEKSL